MLRTDLKKHICGSALVNHYNAISHKVAVASVGKLPSKYIEQTSCDSVAHHSAKFLFLPDITNKATGIDLVILIVLYVGSQLASTLIATATADPNQRRMMLLIPIVFVVILYRYPAGLLVYWITTNVWTIGQQFLIRRHMGPPPKAEVAAGESNGKPTRSIRQALADATSGGASAKPAPVGAPTVAAAPPRPPPRKKKKRSGRRR
jgi:YidC/Oxa1 family membrane protein insertase